MGRAPKSSKDRGFESALERLEVIVKNLEQGDLPLEESLRLFEEGVALTRQCAARLDEAQRRIEILTREADGAMRLRPFDAAPDAGENDDSSGEEG